MGTGSITINQATPAFSNLISPTIPYGTATTQLEGTISLGSLYPTGNVSITLNSVTQATINPDGTFSASFNTGALMVSGSPYAITYHYGGDANFSASPASSAVPRTVNTRPTSTTVALAPSSVAVQIPSTPHDHRHGRGDYRTFGTGGTWDLRACGQHLEYRP